MTDPATLHYVYDPLCGWCYGAAPLIEAARQIDRLQLVLHGGGLMAGPRRRTIDAAFGDFVKTADARIAAATNQPFTSAYYDGLLGEIGTVLDSAVPIAGVLAAEHMGGQGAALLARLQRAHYVAGEKISSRDVVRQTAAGLGLDPTLFDPAFRRAVETSVDQHIEDTRAMMRKHGLHGFPSFVLERASGELLPIDVSPYLGQPSQWGERLQAVMQRGRMQ